MKNEIDTIRDALAQIQRISPALSNDDYYTIRQLLRTIRFNLETIESEAY